MSRKKSRQAHSSATSGPAPQDHAQKPPAAPAPRRPRSAAEQTPGMARKSTMYMATLLALAVGLYLGALLPSLTAPARMDQRAAPKESAPPQGTGQEQERNAQRILELEAAVRKNPEDAAAWVRLGNLYFDMGKAPGAVNAYERALLLKPGDPDVLTDLGIMYRDTGNFDMAVESFRKASKANPGHQNALFNQGVVLFFDLGRKDDARKAWRRLLNINPDAAAPDGKPVKDLLRELK